MNQYGKDNDRMEVAYGDRRYVVHPKQANFFDQTPLARFIREGDVYLFSCGGRVRTRDT